MLQQPGGGPFCKVSPHTEALSVRRALKLCVVLRLDPALLRAAITLLRWLALRFRVWPSGAVGLPVCLRPLCCQAGDGWSAEAAVLAVPAPRGPGAAQCFRPWWELWLCSVYGFESQVCQPLGPGGQSGPRAAWALLAWLHGLPARSDPGSAPPPTLCMDSEPCPSRV